MQKIFSIENDSERIIIDYLKKKNLLQTLETFQNENRQKTSKNNPIEDLKNVYFHGKGEEFFIKWNKLKQNKEKNMPIQENIKLELYLHIYFVIYPIHTFSGGMGQINSKDIDCLKKFLEEKGPELAKFPEVIPFFALPYFKDLKNHQSFKNLFQKQWMNDLTIQLNDYISKNFQVKEDSTELDNLLQSQKSNKGNFSLQINQDTSIENQEKQLKIQDLEKQLQEKNVKLAELQEESKNTMKDIHQKWANFVSKTLDVAKAYDEILMRQNISIQDKENIIYLQQQIQDYESFLHTSLEELFFEDNQSTSPKTRVKNSSIQIINFTLLKNTLIQESDIHYVCALLEALRWKITRNKNAFQRREAIIQFTSQELISYKLFKTLIEKKSKLINEYLMALINAISSEYLGRSFLIENSQLLKHLIFILKNEKDETFIMKNCLGIVQKLSLRKRPQEILIQNDIIKWCVNTLANRKDFLDEYSLEYLTALLLNLSLRTIGKNKFEEIKYTALNLLYEFLNHENDDVKIYVTGTLYSLFSKQSIKKLAIEMNFEGRLEKLIDTSDESMSKKYAYVLSQLKNETMENNLSELNEDENDMDLLEEEELGEEEPNEVPKEIAYPIKGEELLNRFRLEGDQAEKQFQIVSAIMEETLNQSRLDVTKGMKSVTKDSFLLRPSTPLKLPSFNLDKRNFSDVKEEQDYAFMPRPKIGF